MNVQRDDGFGLVEIVISMFILALIAIAFLPLLIQGVTIAAQNRTLATASQIIHDQVEQARAVGECSALTSFNGTIYQPNANFSITGTVEHASNGALDPCDINGDGIVDHAEYPGVVKLNLVVTESGETDVLVETSTLVLVFAPN